jgi:lipoprotein-releasing system permease protein
MAKVNLPMMIGSRYSRAKRRNGFISFISAISIIGVAIGVWVLISVISIMNGFGNELRGRILDVAPHVTVTGQGGWVKDWRAVAPLVDVQQGVVGRAPYILEQGLVSLNGAVTGSLVKGVLPEEESQVSTIADHMLQGDFKLLQKGKYNVVLGNGLAKQLGAGIGDKVTFISPQGQSTPAGLMPRLRRFTVVGVFGGIGPDEFDSALSYIHMDDAIKLYKTRGRVSGLRLKLADPQDAVEVAKGLTDTFQYKFYVDNWTRQHKTFFRALKVERIMVFITLFLIIIIAAFNIVSTLIMVVTDKRADIAILRTLGLSPAKVMGIFFVQGVTSGVIGTVVGAIAGVLTALNLSNIIHFLESVLGFELLPKSVYYVTDFPAELRWIDVSIVVTGSIFICMLATLYPSWNASRTQPAEALRYE